MKRALAICVVLIGLLSACGSDSTTDVATPVEAADGQGVAGCSPDEVGSSEETPFTIVRVVVDGSLGPICLGDDDPTLTEAWETLATIVPPSELADLAFFGGFTYPEGDEAEEETFAFVTPEPSGETFQMAVNLPAFEADPDEALLTIAHEFSHVFTSVPTQIDRSDEAFETCTTYLSASGCFVPGSLIDDWVDTFWPRWIEGFDPNAEATVAGGEDRCALDPGFFGPYAASDPEEDFAESFSAFVFRLPAQGPQQQARLDFLEGRAELVAYRDRTDAAGLTPRENTFARCG